jgi:hypothetical protein
MSTVSIDQILELPAAEELPLTAAQRNVLEQRWQAFEKGPDEGELWDDVKRSLLQRPS